jgi:superfamily II DNA or RNA helicase
MGKFKIRLFDTICTITPATDRLKSELTCNRVKFEQKRGKRNIRTIKEEMFVERGNELLACAGLVDSIYTYCSKHGGYDIIEDHRTPLEKPNTNILKGIQLRARQDEMLDVIHNNYNGILKCPTGMGKSFIIELVCGMYAPQLKIVVAAPRKSICKDLYDRILARNPTLTVGRVDSQHRYNENYDVIVASAQSLHNIEREWPQLFIYDEVHTASSEKLGPLLTEFTCKRRYGFSATPFRSDGTEKIIENVFGPIRIDIDYQEAVAFGGVLPMKVGIFNLDSPELSYKQPISVQRHGLWKNKVRNEKIRDICQHHKGQNVLVMCDKVEHALYLHKLLPDYKIVHSGISQEKYDKWYVSGLIPAGMPREINKDDCLEEFKNGTHTKWISTLVWGTGVDIANLEVLIRCDGQSGKVNSIQIPGRASRINGVKEYGILYDFIDNCHDMLKGKSWSRYNIYKNLGWDISWDKYLI